MPAAAPADGQRTRAEPFRLAHFYDPDAPFRDNRIVLPVDTSLAGLRKFPKAVKMELSAQLRKQIERVQAIKLKRPRRRATSRRSSRSTSG